MEMMWHRDSGSVKARVQLFVPKVYGGDIFPPQWPCRR
jgi:hypothetical protein